MNSLPHPLTLASLSDFCHPHPDHALHLPRLISGTAYAGNCHLAIAAVKGAWLDSDFLPAPEKTAARFTSLPWSSIPADDHPEWTPLDNIRGDLFARARIAPFMENHKRNPSPVWRVNATHLIRLSHLQLLATLPGSRIHTGSHLPGTPAYLRFSGGGLAIVPQDPSLTRLARNAPIHSRDILRPVFHPLRAHRIVRTNTTAPSFAKPPPPEPPIDNWPPPEPLD